MDDAVQTEAMRAEAAQWVARLDNLPVSTKTLDEFFAWRRVDGHKAAFAEVSGVWDATARLRTNPRMQALADEAYRNGPQRSRPKRRSGVAIAGLAAACVAGIVALGIGYWPVGETYSTRLGEQSVVALEDGSRIALDTDTRLRVHFTRDRRDVELEHGQAYFTVAHDTARPFVVDADAMGVRATGTQFDVKRTGEGVEVTLVEGKVEVTPASRPTTQLAAGQQLTLPDGGAPRVRRVDTASLTAWRQGRIVLDDATLGDAIAEINRYARKPVMLDAPELAGERIGGSFDTGDVDAFIAAVTAILPLSPVTSSDGSVHLQRKSQQAAPAI
jgi:transmembrane sensor